MRKLVSIALIAMMLIVLAPAPGGATLAMHQSLATADVKISSYAVGGGLGYSVAIVGDVNGDGYDDYMATDMNNDTWKGNAYLFWGRNASFPTDASKANVTFHSEGGLVEYVYRLGDVNGDGFDDFMIGSPDQDGPLWDSGAAYIFFGAAGGWGKYLNVTAAPAIIRGKALGDIVGVSAAGVGDANGDGRDDFVLGCYGKDSWGVTYLYLGRPFGSPRWNKTMNLTDADASFHGKDAKSYSGYSLAGGDVNGDGLDDIIIGTPGSDFPPDNYITPGYTYVVFGRTSGWAKGVDLSTGANASLMGEHYDDSAGWTVAVPGDVNGDGFEDILIGTGVNDEAGANAGKAYLYLGRSSGWAMSTNLSGADASWRGEAAGDTAGIPLSPAGDVNGDSLADFMIGAQHNSDQALTGQGQVYLFLGKKVGWAKNQNINTATSSWLGVANNGWAPSSLAGKGDINGDALDDLLIGDIGFNNPPGRAYIVFPVKNTRPTNITKVSLFADAGMTKHATYVKLHDQIFVRLKAKDADAANANVEQIRVKSAPHDSQGFEMDLLETGINTGIFSGSFFVENYTQPDLRWIKALPICRVRAEAVKNTSAYDEVSVGGSLKIDSLTVMPGNSPTLYAMKQAYAVRVNITDSLGNDHLDHVNLSMPIGVDRVNFTWYHDANFFQTTFNPRFYVILDQSSGASNPSQNRSVATFKVYVNWTFPDNIFHTVYATAVTKDLDYVTRSAVDSYRVETHLDFYGTLKVTGKSNRVLTDGQAIGIGEKITFTNVLVVYKGTTDIYPPNAQFTVLGLDSDGNPWFSPDSSGSFIMVVVEAPYYTYKHFNVTIDIDGVPPQCVNRTYKYSFNVDGDQVTFSDPRPSSTEWQVNKRVLARVNITDTGGSMVKANTVDYRLKLNGGQWGIWKSAQLTGYMNVLEASVLADLNDGPSNMIEWKATDGVGNLDGTGNMTTSPTYIIKVDTVPPVVSNMWPGPGNVSKVTSVSFGLRFTDTWSQVKGETIQYTVSTDDQNTWSNWTNTTLKGSKPLFDCKANWTFLNGSKNWVRWKATDNVGNLVLSDPLKLVVNTTPPKPANRKPVPQFVSDKLVNVGSVLMFQANATDPDGDALTFSLTQSLVGMVIAPKGLFTYTPTKDQVGLHNVTIMVTDGKLSANMTFVVNVVLPRPSIALSDPTVVFSGFKNKVTLTGTASGGVQGIQSVQWCIDNGTWQTAQGTSTWTFTFDTKSVNDGRHNLTIKVTDGIGTETAVSYDIAVKNGKVIDGDGTDMLPLIIGVVVAVVAGIGVGAFLMMRKKKDGPGQTLPPPEPMAKDGVKPS